MKKNEFLRRLQQELSGYEESEQQAYLSYCEEMIDDRMEEGMSEEEAVGDEKTLAALVAEFQNHAGAKTETNGKDAVWSRDMGGICLVELNLENARIRVKESPDSCIRIRYLEDPDWEVKKSLEDGQMVFSYKEKEGKIFGGLMRWFVNGHHGNHTVTVELPRALCADVTLLTGNASIECEHPGFAGEMVCRTSNAAIRLGTMKMDCSVDCSTSNGRISLQNLSACNFTAHTSNGRIEGESICVQGKAVMTTTNGRIQAAEIRGEEAELHTTNGSIRLGFGDLQSLVLRSSNGSIQGKLAGTLRDYSITSGTSNGQNTLPPSLPGGVRNLSVHTSNGSIRVECEA